jgi:glycosidase
MRSPDGLKSKEGGYGRTGARTPMQWDTTPNAGFSTAPRDQLYLPVEDSPDRPNVAVQRVDDASLLNHIRRLIALRLAHPALCASGTFEPVYAQAGKIPFIYKRQAGEEEILVAINPAKLSCEGLLDGALSAQLPECLYGEAGVFQREGHLLRLRLPGVSGGVYKLKA